MSIENTLERIANALEKIANKSEIKQEQAAEVAKYTAQLEAVSEPVAPTPITKSTGRPKKEKEVKEPIAEAVVAQPTSAITLEVLRARARQLGELDRPSAVAIVTSFGVATLGDIPQDKFEEAYAAFDRVLLARESEVL